MVQVNISEENIKHLEKVSIEGLIKELVKETDSISVEDIVKLVSKVKKKYQLNKKVMNAIVQKVWMDDGAFTESSIVVYAKELKKFKITSAIDALQIFDAMDDMKLKMEMEKEAKAKRAEELENKRKEEKARQLEIDRLKEKERERVLQTKKEKEEQLNYYLSSTEPEVMLNDVRSGKRPFPHEISLLKDLKEKYGLPLFVINPLLQFVLMTNDNKLSERLTKRYAEILKESDLKSVQETLIYFRENVNELHKVRLDVVSSSDKFKELGYHDKKYLSHLKAMYFMDEDMGIEIVNYSKNLNQNFLITWFTDKVVEFVVSNSPKDVEAVKALIKEFHTKYILPMGK